MFQLKICGVMTPEDARSAVEAGADAIGLNFYSGSPRCVSEATAKTIIEDLPIEVAKVGVFVNMPVPEIRVLAERLQIDWIQLHGDEPPESILHLAPWRVIRAIRCGSGWKGQIGDYLVRCRKLGGLPGAVLADTAAGTAYGGTGQTANWNELGPPHDCLQGVPLILAGGLTADNVAAAIDAVQPCGVDTASGVEVSPGKKDARRMADFVSAARMSFGLG